MLWSEVVGNYWFLFVWKIAYWLFSSAFSRQYGSASWVFLPVCPLDIQHTLSMPLTPICYQPLTVMRSNVTVAVFVSFRPAIIFLKCLITKTILNILGTSQNTHFLFLFSFLSVLHDFGWVVWNLFFWSVSDVIFFFIATYLHNNVRQHICFMLCRLVMVTFILMFIKRICLLYWQNLFPCSLDLFCVFLCFFFSFLYSVLSPL